MFDVERMLRLNARNVGITLMPYFVRQSIHDNPLLILSFCQNFDLYVNEQMVFDGTRDLQLHLVYNDI